MAKESNKKIELLQTDYAKEQFAKFEKERRQVVFRRRRLVAFFVAALAIFAIVGIQMFNDQMRLQKLKEYKAETVAEQKRQNKRWLHWSETLPCCKTMSMWQNWHAADSSTQKMVKKSIQSCQTGRILKTPMSVLRKVDKNHHPQSHKIKQCHTYSAQ